MGTTAWGGLGKGECLLCNGWFWCGGRPLLHPSLLLLTAVPPKLSGVLIIRLCGRTTQPSATPASPPVSMRGTINPELHSVLLKETKRWCVGTQPRAQLGEATQGPRVTLRHGFEVLVTMLPTCTRDSSLPMRPAS